MSSILPLIVSRDARVNPYIIYWTWCFPQSFLGAVLFLVLQLFNKPLVIHYPGSKVVITESAWIMSGISLGMYVFISSRGYPGQQRTRLILHELGHAHQSLLLGPLYLLVVGIPSLLWAVLKSLGFFKGKPDSWMYTEKWADRLGEKIDRGDI
jgi:hypothetical protein